MSKHASWHTQPHKPRGFGNSLGGLAAKTPASPDELWAMRRRAWRDTGVAVLRPDDIQDDFARQAVVNVAEKLFGPRPKPPHVKQIDGEEGAR
jgi:hypothetical protein